MSFSKWLRGLISLLLVCTSTLSLTRPVSALTKDIYTDALAQGWDNWSWGATLNFNNTSPLHGGSKSIAVTLNAWGALSLHKSGVDTQGVTHLRFYLHGGSSGGQRLNLFCDLEVNGVSQSGPVSALPQPPANTWIEVKLPLTTLNPSNALITRIHWQDASGSTQPQFFIDDIALTSDESPDGPVLSQGVLFPRALPANGSESGVVRVQVSDPQGAADIAAVLLDASSMGRGSIPLKDDGRSNDGAAGDGVFGTVFTVAPGLPSGEARLLVTAVDQAGHSAALPLGAFNILDPPGGAIPAGLPQRIGWGTNEWSETAGQDWQVNSGVPWDYVYQYITYNWETWGSNFVYRFVQHAWDNQYIPVVTVYMVLGTPPDCGEDSTCYAVKLQNPAFISAYLASLQRAAQQAAGSRPVIFALEPDFYGYMQQLSNSSNRPAGVQPDNPGSYPAALNLPGYPNTLVGFGQRMVDVIHQNAPNALAAPMASMWATNADPQAVTPGEAIQMARRTAAFIQSMGGDRSDLLVVEWSDRDAGSGLRPWWDDSDQENPRPSRAILWENALSRAAGKRLLLWQMPAGNMALDNTCNHYRDNRAAYAFNHPRDLFDAGVLGVVFGGGASCMTSASTDGGFIAAQGTIAYAQPTAPTGFSASPMQGVLLPLRWNENSLLDQWGYRLAYRRMPDGAPQRYEAGRRNAHYLFLPKAGVWEIQVIAYDAMGNESAPSSPLQVTALVDALQVFLPLIRR